MQGDFVYSGFEAYIAALNQAAHGIDPAADKAVEAGGQVVFDAMLNNAHFGQYSTGELHAHLAATGKSDVRHEGNMPVMEIGLLELGGVGARYGKQRKGARKKGSSRRGGKVYPREFLYGVILEYGSSSMAAQPYVRPAFDESKGRVVQAEIASLKASGMLP